MLKEINSLERIPEFIKRAKDKNDSFRLMGFGHRVYKNYDPRATVLRDTCREVLEVLGETKNPLLAIALYLVIVLFLVYLDQNNWRFLAMQKPRDYLKKPYKNLKK